jgi:hypothetical protein
MNTLQPSQPSTYTQLMKQSFKLYRASFSHVILFSILLSITAFVPRFLAIIIGQDLFLKLPPLSPNRLWLSAVDIVCLIFLIGIIWRMHCVMRDRHEPLIEDIVMGIKKVIYVFIAALIQTAIVFVVTVSIYGLQILAGMHHLIFNGQVSGILLIGFLFIGQFVLIIYLNTLFVFLTPLIATENKGIFSAIERSASLVWNHWWRVFSVQITPWLVYFLTLMIIRNLLHIDIHIYFLEQEHHTLWPVLFQLGVFALFIPWIAAVLLIQLRDLELRKPITA